MCDSTFHKRSNIIGKFKIYERLKRGRLERKVKESNKERFELDNNLKQFIKDNKEFNFLQNDKYCYNNISNNLIAKKNKSMKKLSNFKIDNISSISQIGKKNVKYNNKNIYEGDVMKEEIKMSTRVKEKENEIPLFYIDVKVKQGIIKKLFVYEGDTPENLAEEFAKENHIDSEKKNELQKEIYNHMPKLIE